MSVRFSSILIAVAVACAGLVGAWTARELVPTHPRLENGTWLIPPRTVGPLSLIDQSGAPFSSARLDGAPALLYFGYTQSTNVCPAMLEMLAHVARSGVVPDLRIVFVTLDPAQDRPDRLARYVSAFDPHIIALTGSQREIDAFAARLGFGFERIDLPGRDYTIAETTVLYLLDGSGHVVAIFSGPITAAHLEKNLRRAAPWLEAVHANARESS